MSGTQEEQPGAPKKLRKVWLTIPQWTQLQKEADQKGLGVAEILRRIIDFHYGGEKRTQSRLRSLEKRVASIEGKLGAAPRKKEHNEINPVSEQTARA